MKKYLIIVLFLAILTIGVSCGNKQQPTPTDVPEGQLIVNQEQFTNSNMQVGVPAMQVFHDKVNCKGYVFAPANSMSKVCPPVAGKVVSLNYKLGDRVKAGQVIATLSGNEFMTLQQNFAEAAAMYQKAKSDFDRAQALWAEKIGAEKDFIAAQSAYRASNTLYESLRSRLAALHVNTEGIANGRLYKAFPVVAPINGYLTAINAVLGQYISEEDYLVEIVNTEGLQLRLSVYSSDVNKLRVGQRVIYGTAENSVPKMEATLRTIGKTVNEETKMVDCIASLSPSNAGSLINDSYVEAQVVISERKALALPSTAIQKEGNDCFVYVVEKHEGKTYTLKKTAVKIGSIDNEYTEIDESLAGKQVLLRGIDTLI